MSDPSIREGYVQGAMARSMEKAAANPNGAMNGFMGVQMGMNAFGSSFASASASNQQQDVYKRQAPNVYEKFIVILCQKW